MFRKLVLLFFFWFSPLHSFAISAHSNLIALSTYTGVKLFNQSHSGQYFWRLNLQFVTQQNLNFCSIASSIMVLNALNVSAPKDSIYSPYKIFTQNNFFTDKVQKILNYEHVEKEGSTLGQISNALATFPVVVKKIHANETTLSQFRETASETINKQSGYIIVNFLRQAIGENGVGHMSPLAAYDRKSDRFLLLDVARYRYSSVWIKTELLWKAMYTIDKDAAAYRGFIIVSKK